MYIYIISLNLLFKVKRKTKKPKNYKEQAAEIKNKL